ncbi:putative membrane protein (TIGR02234 family) [Microbacterium resistens]|uniref:Membrane protein (TIGR02234 family) n=1 Tax=Microbacterium resistens TaxID=156977 RepID=A0ABU1SFZ1_9MICO|nr:Trp biosynthesis-associated membrane protein [Microbacterium resistens]MDR6868527.1 putative membrane protein (TIGR02234 family) [Microbacterium resistens]
MIALTRRGRSLSVLLMVIAGGIGIISSTQTWLTVTRADGGADVPVPGATALPVLAPLSLTALALGAAVALVGPVLRYVFAAIAVAVAVTLGVLTTVAVVQRPISAVAPALTEVTGLAGEKALHGVVGGISATPWPWFALAAWALLLLAGVLVLVTARGWRSGGRRFQTAPTPQNGPVDAVESWDELSHGTDPTR